MYRSRKRLRAESSKQSSSKPPSSAQAVVITQAPGGAAYGSLDEASSSRPSIAAFDSHADRIVVSISSLAILESTDFSATRSQENRM